MTHSVMFQYVWRKRPRNLVVAIMTTIYNQEQYWNTCEIDDQAWCHCTIHVNVLNSEISCFVDLSDSEIWLNRGHLTMQVCWNSFTLFVTCYIISYPLFADADMRIYPHAVSQCHARLKAKRDIAMLSVDKFPYLWKQTRGNEFIPCPNDICHILKPRPQL